MKHLQEDSRRKLVENDEKTPLTKADQRQLRVGKSISRCTKSIHTLGKHWNSCSEQLLS
jgi:hypothetical protein